MKLAWVTVVAAVLVEDGRILICKRPPHKLYGGRWEFPGGKVEPGETGEEALERELLEELNIAIEPLGLYFRTCHDTFQIDFYLCRKKSGEMVLREHMDYAFVPLPALGDYPLCAADALAAKKMASIPRYRHYIWDFDGTLADTYPGMTRAMGLALTDLGITPGDALDRQMKVSVRHAMAQYPVDPVKLKERYAFYEHALVKGAAPMPGVVETLHGIAALGGQNHIYTHRGSITVELARLLFPDIRFAQIITGADGYSRKPAPDALLALLKEQGIKRADALMVGDRDIDIQCAKAAGIDGCLFDPQGDYQYFETPYRVSHMAAFSRLFINQP